MKKNKLKNTIINSIEDLTLLLDDLENTKLTLIEAKKSLDEQVKLIINNK